MTRPEDYFPLKIHQNIIDDFSVDQGSPFSELIGLTQITELPQLRQDFRDIVRSAESVKLLTYKEPLVNSGLFARYWQFNSQVHKKELGEPFKRFRPIKYLLSNRQTEKNVQASIKMAEGQEKGRHKKFTNREHLINDILIIINIFSQELRIKTDFIPRYENPFDVWERNFFLIDVMTGYDRFKSEHKNGKLKGDVKLTMALENTISNHDFPKPRGQQPNILDLAESIEIKVRKGSGHSVYQSTFNKSTPIFKDYLKLLKHHLSIELYFDSFGPQKKISRDVVIKEWIENLIVFFSYHNINHNRRGNLSKNQVIAVAAPFMYLEVGGVPDLHRPAEKSMPERLAKWINSCRNR